MALVGACETRKVRLQLRRQYIMRVARGQRDVHCTGSDNLLEAVASMDGVGRMESRAA